MYSIPVCCFVVHYTVMLFCFTVCHYVYLLYNMLVCCFVVQYVGMLIFFTVCRYAVSDSVCGSGGMYPRGGVQIIGNITDLSLSSYSILFIGIDQSISSIFFSNYFFLQKDVIL